ncbi:MAG: hypothetical protein KF862_20700 [Chitinophagaceae bacterium]|nr:hypothetical protein [Chitinophagaceae bacterium]
MTPYENPGMSIPLSPAYKYPGIFFSWIFHPLLVGLYMALFLIYGNPDYFIGVSKEGKLQTLLIYIINSVFFPLVSILLCKALGFVQSVYLRTQKERIVLYSITMIFFFWTFYVFKNKTGVPVVMAQMSLGIFFASIAAFIANIYLKISMHAIGVGGLTGLFTMLLYTTEGSVGIPLAASILIAGITCTARLIVSDHTSKEISWGFVFGFLCQVLAGWFI